jgi:hypothetical protein
VVSDTCDFGTATGVQNVNVQSQGCPASEASATPTTVVPSGANVTAYFDKPQNACLYGGCAVTISFNVTCCQ